MVPAISLGLYFNGSNLNKHVRKRNRFSEKEEINQVDGFTGIINQSGGK